MKGAIKNGQSRETCSIGYTTQDTSRRQIMKNKNNTIDVGHHYVQAPTTKQNMNPPTNNWK